ncbi:hypothetical protein ASPFODRAFT_144646 [Aspergillus luchuensis CBS 106.47]|uniref:Uncharacterized protein n=1 Tax=Aspergillus luchuensis (strain CBS 106.47) TaxID=1137211 RepID=A0A1M3T5G2_ASPLC|nr:hypothetical protein ASPFODRAFT_144646 [Aspergillus luchuensis CBS 106.47]
MEQFIEIVSQYFPMLDVLRNIETPRRLAANGDMSPPKSSPVEHLLRNNPELYRGLEKAALATGHVEEGLRRQLYHAQQSKESMRLELAKKQSDIRSLTQQIQALNFQPNVLSDDDIAQNMRRLLQRLRNWSNTYFRDLEQLNKLRQHLEHNGATFVPRGPHEVRAFIASVVSQILFQRIFSLYLLGIPNEESGRFVSIAETLRQNCPGNTEHHWRTATSIAAEKLGDEQSDINMVASQVEIILSQYYSVEPSTVARRLRALVQECMQFKRDLDRQLSRYHFFRSALGDNFAPDYMQHAIPFQEVAGRVQCTLWPGLYKESTSGALVVVPETVLATKDAEDQSPTCTEVSNTLVPGLQDVSDHLSDSGESVGNEGVSCRDLAFDIELGGDTV